MQEVYSNFQRTRGRQAMTHTPFPPAGRASPHRPSISQGACPFFVQSAAGRIFFKNMARRELPPGSACQKTCVEKKPLKLGRGSSRGRQPASSGIECPECLAWQGVQRAQRGLFRRAAAGKYRHSCRLSEKSLDFFDSLDGRPQPGPPVFISPRLRRFGAPPGPAPARIRHKRPRSYGS